MKSLDLLTRLATLFLLTAIAIPLWLIIMKLNRIPTAQDFAELNKTQGQVSSSQLAELRSRLPVVQVSHIDSAVAITSYRYENGGVSPVAVEVMNPNPIHVAMPK